MTAIRAGTIAVPDDALSLYKLAGYEENLRRALWAIEEGMGGEIEWYSFGGFDATLDLYVAVVVHGKWLGGKRPRKPKIPGQLTWE